MNINKLKVIVQRKYLTAIDKAETERDEDLKAIDKVLSISEVPTTYRKTYGELTEHVKDVLKSIEGEFNKRDIKNILEEKMMIANMMSLTTCLVRLEKQQLIKTIKKGVGALPSIYIKVGTTDGGRLDCQPKPEIEEENKNSKKAT